MLIKDDPSTMIAETSGLVSVVAILVSRIKQAETFDSCEVSHHHLGQQEKTGSHGERIQGGPLS